MKEITPLSKENRKAKIAEIISDDNNKVEGMGRRILYGSDGMKSFPAYKIPIDCIVYNPYNGRIASRVKTYEKEYHKLNPENTTDKKIIEKFLWESDKRRNEITLEDIVNYGQNIPGVITRDGLIADGNRRASILNRICENTEKYDIEKRNRCSYFIAVVLPDKPISTQDLLKLELNIQLADPVLEYNSIEKYLKCAQLKENNFDDEEIRELMHFTTKAKVKEALDVKKLMDEYLEFFGYDGIYTCLDKSEDLFLGLRSTIEKIKQGKPGKEYDWSPDEDLDVNDLKIASFNYIRYYLNQNRAEKDVNNLTEKTYRYVTGANKNNSFFCNQKAWQVYIHNTANRLREINENENSLEEFRKKYNGSKVEDIIISKDKEWSNKVHPIISEGFGKSKEIVENTSRRNEPEELIKKATNTIESIDADNDAFKTENVYELLKKLNSTIWHLMQKNKGKE